MSTFRAFQTGLEAGQKQAKVRREDDARMKASEAYGMGNFEGAVTGLMTEGLTQDASNYSAMGQQAQTRKQQQTYATALGGAPDQRTGYQNLRQSATAAGDPDTILKVDEALKGMDAEQAAQFGQGMEFLGQTALGLKGVPPEARGQAAMEIIQSSPYANPQILQQIQQAAADGKITDEELDNFAMQTMSVAERVKMAKGEKPKYTNVTTRDGVIAYNDADPTDRITLGQAPLPASQQGGGNGLTTNQELQFQFKLDDLDRELGDKEKKRQMDLSTVNNSIALLDGFVTDKDTFNEVYGNWINPTGEGNDLLNPRVQPGSARANGMAILEQIGGRAFLDSIGAMRGTGPLSDREGAKVGAAATRLMNVTQGDEAAATAAQEFRAALVAYKTALEQDIQNSRAAEAARRQQMETMMGRPPSAAPPATQAPQTPAQEDDEDNAFLDKLFGRFEEIAGAAPPSGVDPDDWKYFTPEMKQQFMAGRGQ